MTLKAMRLGTMVELAAVAAEEQAARRTAAIASERERIGG